MDAIRQKFGHAAIGAASQLNNDMGLDDLSIDLPTKEKEK